MASRRGGHAGMTSARFGPWWPTNRGWSRCLIDPTTDTIGREGNGHPKSPHRPPGTKPLAFDPETHAPVEEPPAAQVWSSPEDSNGGDGLAKGDCPSAGARHGPRQPRAHPGAAYAGEGSAAIDDVRRPTSGPPRFRPTAGTQSWVGLVLSGHRQTTGQFSSPPRGILRRARRGWIFYPEAF